MQASSTGVNGTTELTTSAKAPDRAGYFRQDIQGLRAVAVLLVVLYHAHLNVLSGGYTEWTSSSSSLAMSSRACF